MLKNGSPNNHSVKALLLNKRSVKGRLLHKRSVKGRFQYSRGVQNTALAHCAWAQIIE